MRRRLVCDLYHLSSDVVKWGGRLIDVESTFSLLSRGNKVDHTLPICSGQHFISAEKERLKVEKLDLDVKFSTWKREGKGGRGLLSLSPSLPFLGR